MEAYEVSSFARLENSQLGQGYTTSYTNRLGEQLAYIDYNHDRTEAGVVVFTPYNGGERRYSQRPVANAEAIIAKHLAKQGYEAPVEVDEAEEALVAAQQKAEQQIDEQWNDFTEEDEANGLKRLLADVEAALCPRCGINTLAVERPALNARSRYAPIWICSPCSTHESLSKGGLDLWHDKAALVAALDEQRAADRAADEHLQRSVERARQARAERIARETLCEASPAQKSALAAAVVWPA